VLVRHFSLIKTQISLAFFTTIYSDLFVKQNFGSDLLFWIILYNMTKTEGWVCAFSILTGEPIYQSFSVVYDDSGSSDVTKSQHAMRAATSAVVMETGACLKCRVFSRSVSCILHVCLPPHQRLRTPTATELIRTPHSRKRRRGHRSSFCWAAERDTNRYFEWWTLVLGVFANAVICYNFSFYWCRAHC